MVIVAGQKKLVTLLCEAGVDFLTQHFGGHYQARPQQIHLHSGGSDSSKCKRTTLGHQTP